MTIQDTNLGTVSLECKEGFILHRIGSEDFPTIKRLTTSVSDRDNWEIIPYVDPEVIEAINTKLEELNLYDSSKAVNSLSVNGKEIWLDKATRVGLMNSLNCEKNVGRTRSNIWFDTMSVNMDIDKAIQILTDIEFYALECFNVTAFHRKSIKELRSVDEVKTYNFTTGYPKKLVINTEGEI